MKSTLAKNIIFVLFFTITNYANAQFNILVHNDNDTIVIPTSKVDSVSFDMTPEMQAQMKMYKTVKILTCEKDDAHTKCDSTLVDSLQNEVSAMKERLNQVLQNYENMQKKLTELEFENDSLKNRCYKLEEENPFKWATLNKTKVVIVIDDCNENLPKIYDLTHAMNIPLSVACISSRLNTSYKTAYDYTTNIETTLTTARKVKDILSLVVADGGEVHCHGTNTTPLDENSTYEDYRNVFVNAKRAIESEGFKVRGIMRIGGNYYDVDGSENMQKWASAYYDYSDRYGNKEPYFHPRLNVASSTTNDGFISRMNTEIAKGNDNKIIVFMMHGSASNTSLEYVVNFRSLLEQIKTTYGNTLEFTTLANVYDNFKSTYFAEEIKKLKNN